MVARPARTLSLLILLAAASGQLLSAQCPDGSRPPCGTERLTPIDSNLLAIFPFKVTGPTETQYIGEGLSTLLSFALDGVAGWRVISPQTMRSQVGGARSSAPPATLALAARRLGAGTLVLGNAVTFGSELRVRVELYDTRTAKSLGTVEARVALDHPEPGLDSLATGLMRQRLRDYPMVAPRPLSEYTTGSPEALRLFLRAEGLQRENQWQASVDSLFRAITIDSTFGLAYYRLYVASTMGNLGIELPPGWGSHRIVRTALRHADRLTPRSRALLEAVAAQQEGLRLDAISLSDQFANRYPDAIEAAYIQGESGWHFGLSLGLPPEAAIRAFDRFFASDSGSREGRSHLPALLWLAGDTARVIALDGIGGLMGHVRGPADLTFIDDHPVHDRGAVFEPVLQVLLLLDRHPAWGLALADTIATRIRARADIALPLRAQLLLLISHLRLAQGRYQDAWHLLDEAEAMVPGDAAFATVVHSIVTGQHGADANTVADHLAALDRTDSTLAVNRQLLLAWHAVETGDSLLFATMERRVDSTLRARQAAAWLFRRLDGMRGMIALNRGDSVTARRLLQSGYEGRPDSREFLYMTALRTRLSILLAQLDLAADAPTAALGRLHDTFWLGFVYRAQAEEMRGQIYERMGDMARAIGGYRNFIKLWEHADPELQPRVAAARAAVARLE
ncbi:MAG: hypothetical protein ABI836_13215 [Gemmatimonadota bacterium]